MFVATLCLQGSKVSLKEKDDFQLDEGIGKTINLSWFKGWVNDLYPKWLNLCQTKYSIQMQP